MINQIVPQLWMLIPKEERDYIAQHFGVKKTGITEVVDSQVITDGYNAEDLKAITHEKMTEFIGSEESFMRAWELTVMKAHSELNPPTTFIGNPEQLANLKEVSNEEFKQITKVEPKKTKKGN